MRVLAIALATVGLLACAQLDNALQTPVAQCATGITAAAPSNTDTQQYLAIAMTVPACRALTEALVRDAIARALATRGR